MLSAAAAKVSAGSLAARRVAFMKEQFFDPLAVQPVAWRERMSKLDDDRWIVKSGKSISLHPLEGDKANRDLAPEDVVKTIVTARRTDGALEFRFDCEEPRMKEAPKTKRSS